MVWNSCPASGVDARRAAKGINLQPGIIGQGQQMAGARIGGRLQDSILGECRAGFLDIW